MASVAKKRTTISISVDAWKILAKVALQDNRSISNVVETLVKRLEDQDAVQILRELPKIQPNT